MNFFFYSNGEEHKYQENNKSMVITVIHSGKFKITNKKNLQQLHASQILM